MEICPFEPVRPIPSLLTSILRVDKTGMAFLDEIALLVVFKAWRKTALLIEK